MSMQAGESFDYVIVGGGSAGAVLAARLAENGARVLVLEAGGDPSASEPTVPPPDRPLEADYRVPAFHAFASEHPGISWDYWVRHYADRDRQRQDWRYSEAQDGVLYPRVRALGGCSAHHALITVRPNDLDWNHIWQVTGDESWKASHMLGYFRRIERCRYRFFGWRWMSRLLGWDPTGHGWKGWLTTELAVPLRALRDRRLRGGLLRSIQAAADGYHGTSLEWETNRLDPNETRWWNPFASGIRLVPLSTRKHTRHGPRERLEEVRRKHPERLEIRLHAEVRRILVGGTPLRADGVVYRRNGAEETVRAAKDVVLCAGVFETPKLLMLSGIGPTPQIEGQGIAPVVDLPGVGANLQDRYEVAVVSRMKRPWHTLAGATYTTADKYYRRWRWFGLGNYTSNGILFSVALKSRRNLTVPDLYCFALLADFRGYYKGYSERIKKRDYVSWVILKAYTGNTAGHVRLRSAEPAAAPEILFRYFEEGNGPTDDLDAVVEGIRFVRTIADAMDDDVAEEEEPGRHRDTDEELRDYVRANAWGHHACGTCAMKPREQGGVVDSRFKVHGVEGLRVVDASIFPRIPGYFLATAVYMIAEKAADTLLSGE
ncbi:MAG: oxidoreductase [Xanthobacteraceae bacterium]|jgi:choline dehydrogenase|nr:oxidoreductase [Xanthobacteraceae bacterium]